MKYKKILIFNLILALLVAGIITFLLQKDLLRHLELEGLDLSFRLRGSIPANPHIIIIEIDDADISKVGRWPWERSWHAAMVKALTQLGVKEIYFDFILSEAASQESDSLLQESLKQSQNIYLPLAFQGSSFNTKTAFFPIERFAPYLKGTGAINIYPDVDGTIRRIPLIFDTEKGICPHMAFKLALDYNNLEIKEVTPKYISVYNPNEIFKIPLIKNNTLLINWLGRWEHTFKHYSFLEVLAKYKELIDNKRTQESLKEFKDSICLVAVTAIGLYDIKPIPLQAEYPAIGVMATTISNIIDKKFIYVPAPWINILILYILALLPAFLIFGEKPLKETLLILGIGSIYFMIHYLLFKNGLGINFFSPLLGLFASSLTVGTYNFVRIAIERQAFFKMSVTDGLTNLYNIRYFKMLLETEIILARSDATKRFCIIMSDVDHFKHFNDTYGHQVGDLVLKEMANVLKNSVRYSDIVARYGGEEMIILLRSASLKDGLLIAEKIRKNVESCIVRDQHNSYQIRTSLGVSIFRIKDTVDTIIKRADDGLYKAKESGRNRVSTIEEET